MRFLILFTIFTFLVSPLRAVDIWGPTGHRAVGEIAEINLSKKAKRAIEKLLDGQSLALVSTYADEIRSDGRYDQYAPWHYVNFPFDSTFEAHPRSEQGDLYGAIHKCISVLEDDSSSKDDKAFFLKLLVHFIGDLHQPLHVGIADDRGGNRFQVQWYDEGTNLHTVWDTKILETYGMSYLELSLNRKDLTAAEKEAIQSGTVKDWMYESRGLCLQIYENTEVGENLKYRYMYDYADLVRSQLQKGGLRLAKILNEVFD